MQQNPFEPPSHMTLEEPQLPQGLEDRDESEVLNLYKWSREIRAFGLLWIFGTFLMLTMMIFGAQELSRTFENIVISSILVVMSLLSVVAAFGAYRRPTWGRKFCIGMLILGLLNLGLGTLICGYGIYVFVKARDLFGPHQLSHQALCDARKVVKQRRRMRRKGLTA